MQRYRELLSVAAAISAHDDLHSLLQDLAGRLRPVLHCTYTGVILHDEGGQVMRGYWLDPEVVGGANQPVETPIHESPSGWVWQNQQPLVIPNTANETHFPAAIAKLRRRGAGTAAFLPLTHGQRRLGALMIAHAEPHVPVDLDFARLAADQVAAAVAHVCRQQDAAAERDQLALERDRLGLLLDLNNRVVTVRDLRELFQAVSAGIRRVLRCDSVSLTLPAGDGRHLRVHALDFPDSNGYFEEHMLLPIEGSVSGEGFRTGKPVLFSGPDPSRLAPNMYRTTVGEGIRTGCVVPLMAGSRPIGTIVMGRRDPTGFNPADVDFLTRVAGQVALAVDNAMEFRRIAESRDRLSSEASYLHDQIRQESIFDEIVGTSPVLWRALEQSKAVAPTDAAVLLIGESGTGKELLARLIHDLSPRSKHSFIRAHCAGTPADTLQSELFGHEKNSFRGAISRKLGRVEMADQGTLFLDEVGELAMDQQLQVLRLIKDGEFQRIGSSNALHANVRLIAATTRDLNRLVEDRRFRIDLFYRLNLFPIVVPPLRQRVEDIPLLVRHFVARYASRFQKNVESIPDAALRAMGRYPWPGNVRELQNFVERSVILTNGPVLAAPLTELRRAVTRSLETDRTLAEIERDGILKALRESNWRVGGVNGAASRLGVPRTTLIYKMRKLRITRDGL